MSAACFLRTTESEDRTMKIAHHPDVSTLMTCAAGSQPEVLCAVVASHLSVCPTCRNEVSGLEKIGVALFEHLDPVPLALNAPIAAVKHVAEQGLGQSKIYWPVGDVPAPLSSLIGPWLDDLDWRPIGTGAWQFVIPLSEAAKGDLRLIKIAPGRALPKCGADGEELALVLRGGCRDGSNVFKLGDFNDRDDGADQLIVADEELGSILLIANETELSFGEPQLP